MIRNDKRFINELIQRNLHEWDKLTVDEVLQKVKQLINANDIKFKCGKGGSHVWISDTADNRLYMVYTIADAWFIEKG